jgi:hypothetical protein
LTANLDNFVQQPQVISRSSIVLAFLETNLLTVEAAPFYCRLISQFVDLKRSEKDF